MNRFNSLYVRSSRVRAPPVSREIIKPGRDHAPAQCDVGRASKKVNYCAPDNGSIKRATALLGAA